MDFFLVKNRWVITVEQSVFQVARLLFWHCHLVFKLFHVSLN